MVTGIAIGVPFQKYISLVNPNLWILQTGFWNINGVWTADGLWNSGV